MLRFYITLKKNQNSNTRKYSFLALTLLDSGSESEIQMCIINETSTGLTSLCTVASLTSPTS